MHLHKFIYRLTLNVHQAKGMSYSLASLKSISNSDGLHRSGKQSLSANPFKTALAEKLSLDQQSSKHLTPIKLKHQHAHAFHLSHLNTHVGQSKLFRQISQMQWCCKAIRLNIKQRFFYL